MVAFKQGFTKPVVHGGTGAPGRAPRIVTLSVSPAALAAVKACMHCSCSCFVSGGRVGIEDPGNSMGGGGGGVRALMNTRLPACC